MVNQNLKDLYFSAAYAFSKLLLPVYSLHCRIFRSQLSRAQLGGGSKYISGFINIDGNILNPCDYALDVRAGLPFSSESMDFIYSCHMLEHLHVWEAIALLMECHRVLKKSGYVRLTLPDFRFAVALFTGAETLTTDFPRQFQSRSGKAINFLFCDGQHKYAYTDEVIGEIGIDAGFAVVEKAPDRDPNLPLDVVEQVGSVSMNLRKR